VMDAGDPPIRIESVQRIGRVAYRSNCDAGEARALEHGLAGASERDPPIR